MTKMLASQDAFNSKHISVVAMTQIFDIQERDEMRWSITSNASASICELYGKRLFFTAAREFLLLLHYDLPGPRCFPVPFAASPEG